MYWKVIWEVLEKDLIFWLPILGGGCLAALVGVLFAGNRERWRAQWSRAMIWAVPVGLLFGFACYRLLPREWLPMLLVRNNWRIFQMERFSERLLFFANHLLAIWIASWVLVLVLAMVIARRDTLRSPPPNSWRFRLRTLFVSQFLIAAIIGGWLLYHREPLQTKSQYRNAQSIWQPFGFSVQLNDGEVVGLHSSGQRMVFNESLLQHIEATPSLQHLDLRGVPITDSDLSALAEYSQLESLTFDSAYLSDKGLASLGTWPKLRSLSVMSPHFTDASIGELRACKNLTSLGISGPILTARVLDEIAPHHQLRTLGLHVPLAGRDLEKIAHLRDLNLVVLRGTNLADDGTAPLTGWKKLNYLMLDSPQISDETVARLSKLPALEHLYLMGSSVTDASCDYWPKFRKLKSLDLSASQITDRTLASLAQIKTLEALTLSGTAITDEGLLQLKDLPRLEYVEIFTTGVTAAGRKEFLRHKPGVIP
jgi:hypothetical protein